MIRVLKQFEGRAGAKSFAERFQEGQVREIITRSLQKQHRNFHLEKVLCALVRGVARRMERESKKHESAQSGQRRCGLRMRGHSAAKGLSAGEKWEVRNALCRFRRRRADRGMSEFWGVGPFRTALHVWELIAQRSDAALRQPVRDGGHEWMRHASASAVGQHI